MGGRTPRSRWDSLPPFSENGELMVVVETPRGSRNKYKFDPERGVFCLAKVLPAGMSFPFDFGYVPGTLAEDGDPLDVLLMMDEPVFPGCVVLARPVGIIEAGQRDAGSRKRKRNDRLIAVAKESKNQKGVRTLRDLPRPLIKQVEKFFVFYHQQEGGTFEPIGERGPKQAVAMVERAARAARKQSRRNGNGRQADR